MNYVALALQMWSLRVGGGCMRSRIMGLGKLTFAATLAFGTLAAPTGASAQTTVAAAPAFTSLTVFGDSLVDAGNVFALTRGATPSATQGYFQGRFTNGYDYTDLLSLSLYGTPTVPSALGGTNFAFGGARATTTSQVPDLQEQLGLFSASGQAVSSSGLYVLNFGGNDVFATLAPGAPTGYASDAAFLQQAASIYVGGVRFLLDQGARNFLITGFPVAGPGLEASLLGESFLTTELAALNAPAGTNIYRYSYLDFFQRLTADPTAFGLPANLNTSNVSNCQAARAFPDCTGFFYFDGTHPTAAIQRAAFNDMNRQFGLTSANAVPEPATWAMMLLGFGAIGFAMRTTRRKTTTRFADA
jgi:outer membrane lipase/esterase